MSTRRPFRAVIAALLTAALVTGCGDSGDDEQSSGTDGSSETTTGSGGESDPAEEDPAEDGDPAAEAEQAVRDFIRAVGTYDAATACGLLDEDGEASLLESAEGLQEDVTCEDLIAWREELTEGEDPSFEMDGEQYPLDELDDWPFDVQLSDDGTAATVSSARSPEAMELVLDDDGWRISELSP